MPGRAAPACGRGRPPVRPVPGGVRGAITATSRGYQPTVTVAWRDGRGRPSVATLYGVRRVGVPAVTRAGVRGARDVEAAPNGAVWTTGLGASTRHWTWTAPGTPRLLATGPLTQRQVGDDRRPGAGEARTTVVGMRDGRVMVGVGGLPVSLAEVPDTLPPGTAPSTAPGNLALTRWLGRSADGRSVVRAWGNLDGSGTRMQTIAAGRDVVARPAPTSVVSKSAHPVTAGQPAEGALPLQDQIVMWVERTGPGRQAIMLSQLAPTSSGRSTPAVVARTPTVASLNVAGSDAGGAVVVWSAGGRVRWARLAPGTYGVNAQGLLSPPGRTCGPATMVMPSSLRLESAFACGRDVMVARMRF